MGEPHTASAIPAAELEEFFAEGAPAYRAETEKQGLGITDRGSASSASVESDCHGLGGALARSLGPCCVGVDMPGVGKRHAPDCRNRATAARVMDAMCGETLESTILRRVELDRESLIVDLMLAARGLAGQNIHCGDGEEIFCEECLATPNAAGFIAHAKSCETGHVFALFAALMRDRLARPLLWKKPETPGGVN